MGLTGASGTYARFKDLIDGAIPKPQPELPLAEVMPKKAMFTHFQDDDIGGADSFEHLFEFLHEHYFPRLVWASVTLNPKKSKFWVKNVRILGHQRVEKGVRPSEDKLATFREWPTPTNFKQVEDFCYMLPFLGAYCSGRADLVMIMKQAQEIAVWKEKIDGKTRIRKKPLAFTWGPAQQEAFERAKRQVLETVCA